MATPEAAGDDPNLTCGQSPRGSLLQPAATQTCPECGGAQGSIISVPVTPFSLSARESTCPEGAVRAGRACVARAACWGTALVAEKVGE